MKKLWDDLCFGFGFGLGFMIAGAILSIIGGLLVRAGMHPF